VAFAGSRSIADIFDSAPGRPTSWEAGVRHGPASSLRPSPASPPRRRSSWVRIVWPVARSHRTRT